MGLINSISQITSKENQNAKNAFLAEIDDSGSVLVQQKNWCSFQYYPASVSDHRGNNYVTKTVVGSSHPIYQWVHGSERTISFNATFSADYVDSSSWADKYNTVSSYIKSPMASLISSAKAKRTGGKNDDAATGRSVDVASAIAWLRAKTYPLYQNNNVVKPPPKLVLFLEGSGITSCVGSYKTSEMPCIMTECNVEYEAFFRNGNPRLATVSLGFTEIVQVGKSWKWVSRDQIEKYSSAYMKSRGGEPGRDERDKN